MQRSYPRSIFRRNSCVKVEAHVKRASKEKEDEGSEQGYFDYRMSVPLVIRLPAVHFVQALLRGSLLF
jgi:hypothetical protein